MAHNILRIYSSSDSGSSTQSLRSRHSIQCTPPPSRSHPSLCPPPLHISKHSTFKDIQKTLAKHVSGQKTSIAKRFSMNKIDKERVLAEVPNKANLQRSNAIGKSKDVWENRKSRGGEAERDGSGSPTLVGDIDDTVLRVGKTRRGRMSEDSTGTSFGLLAFDGTQDLKPLPVPKGHPAFATLPRLGKPRKSSKTKVEAPKVQQAQEISRRTSFRDRIVSKASELKAKAKGHGQYEKAADGQSGLDSAERSRKRRHSSATIQIHEPLQPKPARVLTVGVTIVPEKTWVKFDDRCVIWVAVEIRGILVMDGHECLPDFSASTGLESEFGSITDVEVEFLPTPGSNMRKAVGIRSAGDLPLWTSRYRFVQVVVPAESQRLPAFPDWDVGSDCAVLREIEQLLATSMTELFTVQVTWSHTHYPSNTRLAIHETCRIRRLDRDTSISPCSEFQRAVNCYLDGTDAVWSEARELIGNSSPRRHHSEPLVLSASAAGSTSTILNTDNRVTVRSEASYSAFSQPVTLRGLRSHSPADNFASEESVDAARQIWMMMRKDSKGHISNRPSSEHYMDSLQKLEADNERIREIRTRALRNKRSVGVDTLKSFARQTVSEY